MNRAIRFLIPIALIATGVLTLLGCFQIPATRQLQPNFKPRPEFYVGPGHDKPIRLGYTRIDDAFIEMNHRVQVQTLNGWTDLMHAAIDNHWMSLNRWSVSPDRRRFAVAYEIRTSTSFNCLPVAVADTATQYAVLDVNPQGIVTEAHTAMNAPFPPISPARWLEVFDAPTREKLQSAGVFPTDNEIANARATLGWRFNAPPFTTAPVTRPTTDKSAETSP